MSLCTWQTSVHPKRHFWGWYFVLGIMLACVFTLPIKALSPELEAQLPLPRRHVLPASLTQWLPANPSADYFGEIEPSPLGYLLWSEFPVKVYLPSIVDPQADVGEQKRQRQWLKAVQQAIAAWQQYFPLTITETPEAADIILQRGFPPLTQMIDPETGKISYSSASNAQTTYRFYVDKSSSENSKHRILRHRMTITLSPHQSFMATLTTARHELGHALGIWGHSSNPEDSLYASQAGQSEALTVADINTLKKLYQQPTRLGWPLP